MVDTQKLYDAIRRFEFSSRPSSGSSSAPATVGDINRLIEKIAAVLREFVAELEDAE